MVSIIGLKDQDESTTELIESRWGRWPRHPAVPRRRAGEKNLPSLLENPPPHRALAECTVWRLAMVIQFVGSPVKPGMKWATSKQPLFVGWNHGYSVRCVARTPRRESKHLRYQCSGVLRGARAARSGVVPHGVQPKGTYQVRRLRSGEVEEWGLQLG